MTEEILDAETNETVIREFAEEFGEEAAMEIDNTTDSQILSLTPSNKIDTEEEELDIDIVEGKKHLDFDDLTSHLLSTEHLDNFKEFDESLGLDGENLLTFKKSMKYFVDSIKQPIIVCRINRKTTVDNRFHNLVIGDVASGKTVTKNFIKRICNDGDYIETTSLSHPEQLIGKMKMEGRGDKKKAVAYKGILGFDVVMHDEVAEMISEKNDIFAKGMRIKRLAMDPFGKNQISKKLVDDSAKDILKYYSPSRIIDFSHPKILESPFFDTGSFRRYGAINRVTFNEEIDLDEITKIVIDENYDYDEYFENLNRQYGNPIDEITFSQENVDIISDFHKYLLFYLLTHKNKNAFRFGLITKYSMRDSFCKNVLILAASKKEKIPTLPSVIAACKDTILFTLKSIETINELGNMYISADVWGGLDEKSAMVVEYLLRKGALSRETSNVSIRKFWTIIGNVFGCKVTQARGHYNKLKSNGFIDSKKGKDKNSWVWLEFIPKNINLVDNNYNPYEFLKKYFGSVGLEIDKKHVPTQPNDKSQREKFAKKGKKLVVSVLPLNPPTTPQNNFPYISSTIKYKNKNNNIYTKLSERHPQTPAEPTLPTKTINLKGNSLGSVGYVGEKKKNQTDTTKSVSKGNGKKDDRKVQFFESEECKNIKPNHTKEDIKKYLKENPNYDFKKMYEKFGLGCLKFRNEIEREEKK